MKSRQLDDAGDSFKSFVDDMDQAVAAMQPAADKLKGAKWQDAAWRPNRRRCNTCCAPKPPSAISRWPSASRAEAAAAVAA